MGNMNEVELMRNKKIINTQDYFRIKCFIHDLITLNKFSLNNNVGCAFIKTDT